MTFSSSHASKPRGPRLPKPEHSKIQGVCVDCGVNKQEARAKNHYRALCRSCRHKRYGMVYANQKHAKFKKNSCEECGFVPLHSCQLDVDHIDGDRKNNKPENLRTLCANCHRLKTFKSRDFLSREVKGFICKS